MECLGKGKYMTFTGVNTHNMNGISERRIRVLQELTRPMLIQGNKI